jgi:DNA (cytosine-5)-methyltransferase 1
MGEQVAAAVGKSWLDGVCADLEGIDYACGAVVVPACAVNAPHRRDRLWFVADAGHLRGRNGTKSTQPSIPTSSGQSASYVAHATGKGLEGQRIAGCVAENIRDNRIVSISSEGCCSNVADPMCSGRQGQRQMGESGDSEAREDGKAGDALHAGSGFWNGAGWIIGADGKARRVEPGICLLAHGVSARVGKLRAYGNAIVPQVAAEVIAAFMECEP